MTIDVNLLISDSCKSKLVSCINMTYVENRLSYVSIQMFSSYSFSVSILSQVSSEVNLYKYVNKLYSSYFLCIIPIPSYSSIAFTV
jgi:hypothetical protein